MKKRLIIAIDGYSSCGKSTFARMIAKEMDYLFIDSGAMYRAATLYFIRKGYVTRDKMNAEAIKEDIEKVNITFVNNSTTGIQETFLNNENVEKEIRSVEVSGFVSQISTFPEVRSHLVSLQREIGKNRGIVMDGRDIGTVVFPDADLKIFMTASADIRAKRRHDELIAKGIKVDLEDIRKNIISRDITDENRAISPLRRADDAIILDNSRMTINRQMIWVRDIINNKLEN